MHSQSGGECREFRGCEAEPGGSHIQLSLRRAGKLPGQVGTPISRGRENEKDRGPEKAWLLLVSGLIMREEVDRTSGMENP